MNCDCGAEKHGWSHSEWCSTFGANFERHKCEGSMGPCDAEGPGVEQESSRTMYHWDGTGEDPNRDPWLCRDCARIHHEHWDEMWDDYNRGRL